MKSDVKGAVKGMLGSVAASAMGMRFESEGSQERNEEWRGVESA